MIACSTASEPGGWLASTGSKASGASGTAYACDWWRCGGQKKKLSPGCLALSMPLVAMRSKLLSSPLRAASPPLPARFNDDTERQACSST
eukprot:CAMPEP_0115486398 /NCGR_PEP_ID=MMETSP0271-20121206/60413_1 /TAXON_ID=71861 /ORGANISM="Scrippsiella trochoidea, Strain CCMP3099" /LENGTH=89 /DNA_ID=CAMNT_0002914403 /DNA_START=296 /DNA_END=565 /DNA_ORIENTATION=-